jgi:sugar phosphate isomerase/epimerase
LEEAAEAGFGGLGHGPYGYMPLDVAEIEAALESRGLRTVAGTIFDQARARNCKHRLQPPDGLERDG